MIHSSPVDFKIAFTDIQVLSFRNEVVTKVWGDQPYSRTRSKEDVYASIAKSLDDAVYSLKEKDTDAEWNHLAKMILKISAYAEGYSINLADKIIDGLKGR